MGTVAAWLVLFLTHSCVGPLSADYGFLLSFLNHFLITCISFLPFVVVNVWFVCVTLYFHFASMFFFLAFGLNWIFAAEFTFMLFSIHNIVFFAFYVFHTQKTIYGVSCFHNVIANVKTGKGMKRRIKNILKNRDSIIAYYTNKFNDSTYCDLCDYYNTLNPSNSTYSEFENSSVASPEIPEDEQTCENFILQNGFTINDVLDFIAALCFEETADHPVLRTVHFPLLYTFRKQLRGLRNRVRSFTGLTISGWIAYILARIYMNRKVPQMKQTYYDTHGDPMDPENLFNGIPRAHDGCKKECCNAGTLWTACMAYCSYCETFLVLHMASHTAVHGLDFFKQNLNAIIAILGEENEFGDILRGLFSGEGFLSKNIFCTRAPRRKRDETKTDETIPLKEEKPDEGESAEFQSGFFDDLRIMDIIRELLKEETIKTLKSAMKLTVLLTGIITLLQSDFSYEETLRTIKEFEFSTIFNSMTFTSTAAASTDFLNKLIESYQTGDLRTLFGFDKEGTVLREKITWFKATDVSSLNGGVVPYNGLLTETGNKVYHIHEFLMFGRNLREAVVKRITLEEAKIGNARIIKIWKSSLREIDIKISETDVAIDSIGLRKKPFTYMVIGKSSIGKTSVVNILQRVLCDAFNLPRDPSFMYYVNDLLKHWDGFHSSAHTIVWDDASSVKLCEGVDPGFISQMLNVIGNQPFTTPQAHLDNKGNTKVNSRIVAITSNNLTLQSEKVMNAPEAVMRRIDVIIQAELRSEHSSEGMLSKINNNPKGVEDMNYWTFNVFTVAITGSEVRHDQYKTQGDVNRKAMSYNDFELKQIGDKISITELNKMVHQMAKDQDSVQEVVLASGDQIARSEYDPATGNLIFQSGESPSDDETEWFDINRETEGYDLLSRFNQMILWITKVFVYCFIHYPSFTFPVISTTLWLLIPPFYSFCSYCLINIPNFILIPFFVGLTFQFTRLNGTLNVYRIPILLGLDMTANGFLDAEQIERDVERLNREGEMSFWSPTRWYYRIRRIRSKEPAPILVGLTMLIMTIKYVSTYASAAEATHQGFTSDAGPTPSWSIWRGFSNLSQTSKSVAKPEAVLELIANNTRVIIFDDGKWSNAIDLCNNLGSVLCLTNYHTFRPQIERARKEKHPVRFKIMYDKVEMRGDKGGIINGHAMVEIEPDDFAVDEERDTIYFNYQGYTVKDITPYFCLKDHRGNSNTTAYLLKRNMYNTSGTHESPFCHYFNDPLTLKNNDGSIALQGKSDRFKVTLTPPTSGGDCGAPLVQTDGKKTCIVGIHQAAGKDWAVSTRVTQDDINRARAFLNSCSDDYPVLEAQDGQHSLPEIFEAMDADARRIVPSKDNFLDLHHKSVFRQRENPDDDLSGTIDIRGSLGKSSRAQSTKVYPNPMAEKLLLATGLPTGNKIPPPTLRGGAFYRAKRLWLSSVLIIKRNAPLNLVKRATMGYITDVFARLYHPDMSEVRPLSVDESINGPMTEGFLTKYMGALNFSTGAGHPYNVSKRDLLVDKDAERKIFIPAVMNQVDRLLGNFRNGLAPDAEDVLFSSFFKDEALSEKKAAAGKHRVVIASPLAFLIAFRTLFLPILAFMAANRIAFEACPNTIVQSYEWTLQRDFILDNGPNPKFFDGDYKGWDSSLQKVFVSCFFRVAYVVAYLSGNYTREELAMMIGMACVVTDSTVDFFGDVIRFCGFNPSGQPATAQTNCVGGSIMIRLAWLKSGFAVEDFRKKVRLLTYGDDNYGSVAADVNFDKTHIAKTLEPYGITYTNADKTEPITPDSRLEDIEFLKRSWLWEPTIEAHLAPLSLETLGNMCCNIKSSPHESEHDIIASGLSSLIMESFYHGKEVYERIQKAVIGVATGYNLPKGVHKTFEEKCITFNEDSVYFRENRTFILTQLAR